MTDAPERIYAWAYRDGDRMLASCICAVSPCGPFQTEYVRADLATPLDDPRVKALVEAGTELHDKAVEKHQRHRSDIWPVIRKLRAALSALEENQ